MPDATSDAGETDKGAGFMEERTLGPALKHVVGFAREQGRERQKGLSRLMTQPAYVG